MPNNENFNMDYSTNYAMMNQNIAAQTVSPPKMGVSPMMSNQMVYPEIYYKLQPYIMMVCDQVDTYGSMMPTQEMIENITDSIYDDVCRMYPDMAEYAHAKDSKNDPDPVVETARFGPAPGMFGWRFRRRGMFRDLIDILLLSELFRRRRRY